MPSHVCAGSMQGTAACESNAVRAGAHTTFASYCSCRGARPRHCHWASPADEAGGGLPLEALLGCDG